MVLEGPVNPISTKIDSPFSQAGPSNTNSSSSLIPPVTVSDTEPHSLTETETPIDCNSRNHKRKAMTDVAAEPTTQKPVSGNGCGSEEEEEDGGKKGKTGKSRRELPAGAVATLKAWLLSPEHFTHPYPTPQDQVILMQKTGIDKKQLKNWFTNARRRIWKPMLKKQLEQGKITQTGTGGVVALPGAASGLITSSSPAPDYAAPTGTMAVDHSQAIQQNYQQALQQTPASSQQQISFDSYSNTNYQPQQQQPQQQNQQNQQTLHPGMAVSGQFNNSAFYQQGQFNQQQDANDSLPQSGSIGSLPPMPTSTTSNNVSSMNKTDSHQVLMELFARDQDLVRQATEGSKQRAAAALLSQQGTFMGNQGTQIGSQHPMSKIAGGSSTVGKLGNVPSLNSWPHFSSVSSLNNLGTMTGVKSITNMSGADLVSQGSLNKQGNLAQVKSLESMGRADSFAFLEVFFDNPLTGPRGIKREREEDDNVGLSLDAEESSPTSNIPSNSGTNTISSSSVPTAAPLQPEEKDKDGLKRAYDDALAARGLISVSRSNENLNSLALPAKMQRTISQEYLKSMNAGGPATFTSFSFAPNTQAATVPTISNPAPVHLPSTNLNSLNQQYNIQSTQQYLKSSGNTITPLSDPSSSGASVAVPSTAKCALCNCINIDTQLRPCGHMFHGRCLKPSLQSAVGPPKCPICNITMQSAVLAVPTDENPSTVNSTTAYQSNSASPVLPETKS